MSRRAFVVVLDACGVGALPDAAEYGDAGTNTLGHVAEAAGGLSLPTLERLGLGSIVPLRGIAPSPSPVVHGRLHALGPGKDSTAGHWELMGVVASAPAPTYPDGLPPEVVERVRAAAGRDTIGHLPSEGLAALDRWGAEHLGGGGLIVYTSADSVLQIAAHEDVLSVDDLYAACARVREVTDVGRVIARPFTGRPGAFERLPARRDFALAPPSRSYLDAIRGSRLPVHAVGKVGQLFAGAGIDHDHAAHDNATAIAETSALLADLDAGLVFTNLVETDTVFGHRKDAAGFVAALQRIDAAVADWLDGLGEGDLLVLTADHGCDIAHPSSDHTREHAPLLAAFAGSNGHRHDGPLADVGASVLRWLAGVDDPDLPGSSFA
ncbi:MAG: phosphopentomutase [Solirubrobacteraceae bacterium]